MKMLWMGAVASLVCLAACGSGGTSPSAKMSAERSGAAFETVFSAVELDPCLNGTSQQCTCPGGGTVTVNPDTSFTFDNCKATSGLGFTGTAILTGGGQTIEYTLSVFGECLNMAGSTPADSCGGSFTTNCTDQKVDCTMSLNSQSVCEINC